MADDFYPMTTCWFHHEVNSYTTIRGIERVARWEWMSVQVVDSVDCVSMTVSWLFKDTDWTEDGDHSDGLSGQLSDGYTETVVHKVGEDNDMRRSSVRHRQLLASMIHSIIHHIAPKVVVMMSCGNQKVQTAEQWEDIWRKKWTAASFKPEEAGRG